MTVIRIDITELQELRDELDSIIKQIQEMNKKSEARIIKFNELNLTPDMKEQILNTIFDED